MIKRFQGIEGKGRLITALRSQQIVCDEEDLAADLAAVAELIEVDENCESSEFITQGAPDNDLYFILAGRVSVLVEGREVAVRTAGCHVGEMALIDPSARRSASVLALEQTVMARVSEKDFSRIATQYPSLWRRLALELAKRLRQRARFLYPPNNLPVVFIGSSTEMLPIAREIQSGLSHDNILVSVWSDNLFRVSSTAIESLLESVGKSDFSVLLFSADDTVIIRGAEIATPRDNCVFELGLFMGALGRERTFIVKPLGMDIRIPSDLLGVTPLEYQQGGDDALPTLIAPVCHEIRKSVKRLGPK